MMTANKRGVEPYAEDDDGEQMSLAVRRQLLMFGLHEKANLLHPPAVQTARGGEKRVPSLSQREGAQLPVDPPDVVGRRGPRLGALAGARHHRRCDGA